MSQLGRISGPILTSNLERNGVDLTFRNNPGDDDLLYLDVVNSRVGVNKIPDFDLDIDGYTKTTDLIVDNQAILDNITVNANGTFSTIVGPINITPARAGAFISLDRILTGQLEINGNVIQNYQTNGSIVINPNASGQITIQNSTSITGNLAVTGNILLSGDLSAADNIIVGDSPLDVVTVAPDFTQDIIPGIDITYDLGKSNKRWSQLHISDDLTHVDLALPQAIVVSDQMRLDGVTGQIISVQTNDDLLISPDTGITYIERTKWEGHYITNLNDTPIVLGSTGTGYTKFVGTNAIAIPSGGTGDRRLIPEVGETRWNTDLQYIECFDGTVWTVATGAGDVIDTYTMQDLGNVYSLILG
jgi:hypothetical protein